MQLPDYRKGFQSVVESEEIKHRAPQPPDKDPTFVHYWKIFCPEVVKRKNFKPLHLQQLRVLCDLYVRYDKLKALLDLTGESYWTGGGRHGEQIRSYPEVAQINVVTEKIATYSKNLGFILTKDLGEGADPEGEDWG